MGQRIGRPLSTLMVLMAILGIIAWGASMVYKTFIGPIIAYAGVNIDPDQAEALIGLASAAAIFGVVVFAGFYAADWLRNRGVGARLRQQEGQIEALQAELKALRGEAEDG